MITYIITISTISYALMWIDKVKSIYQWWRVSEKTLWTLALAGGVFGILLGMQVPLYHKAGKRNFRIGVPIIMLMWTCIIIYTLF